MSDSHSHTWRFCRYRPPDGWSVECFNTGVTLHGPPPDLNMPDWLKQIVTTGRIGGHTVIPLETEPVAEILWFTTNDVYELEGFKSFARDVPPSGTVSRALQWWRDSQTTKY